MKILTLLCLLGAGLSAFAAPKAPPAIASSAATQHLDHVALTV